ncbi:MAG: SDR family NAD(P)-dependent oxidoreductase [Anaerolineae bacterium]|nr:SDR family NAD(P)-dependent oxidoreductase [Anaerolineae bacterium]
MKTESRRRNTRCGLWIGFGLLTGILSGLYLWRRQRIRRTLPPLVSTTEDRKGTALVTGASSGIGASYARRLAQAGYDLIIVARRRERLETLAETLRANYGREVEVLVADLADEEDVARVAARIAALEDLEILINNAGFNVPGRWVESPVERQLDMVGVHVVAPVRFTRAALPAMVARGRGAVVNVSSLMAFFPLYEAANYAATKSYLRAFTEALYQELEGTGVRAQVLCPGFVRTEMHPAAQIERSGLPACLWMTPEKVVAGSLKDLERGVAISIPGFGYRLLARVGRLLPRWLLYEVGPRIQKARGAAKEGFSEFRKRYYRNWAELRDDLRFMRQNRARMRQGMRALDGAFRERLMLAVTQVNGCRYCAQFHAQTALKDGLAPEEIAELLEGTFDACPEEERIGVLFAQHWADTAGHPDPEAWDRLVETYGPERAGAIEMSLRMIKMGNYMGNTLDYVLYRISGGRWGK